MASLHHRAKLSLVVILWTKQARNENSPCNSRLSYKRSGFSTLSRLHLPYLKTRCAPKLEIKWYTPEPDFVLRLKIIKILLSQQLMAGVNKDRGNSESSRQRTQSSLTSDINHAGVLVTRSCLDNDLAFKNSIHTTDAGNRHQTKRSAGGSREIAMISFGDPIRSEISLPTSLNGDNPHLHLSPNVSPPEMQEYLFGERSHHPEQKTDKKGERIHATPDDLCSQRVTKEKLMTCLLDPEFQGFMEQVEKVWHAMEEDLAAEISAMNH